MQIYSTKKVDNGFVFVDKDGDLHPCCAEHSTPHEKAPDVEACIYVWAMAHTEEFECPSVLPDGKPFPESNCQFPKCERRTRKGLKNELARHGKYLCDEHRKPAIMNGFLPFVVGGYRVRK